MDVILDRAEMAALFRQEPSTKKDGGWQSLLVGLQEKTDKATGALSLTMKDRRRIRMYAFKYKKGGWEDRLKAAFSRHLGSKLDLGLPSPEW
ncbi:MAG: hypothetical protein WBQ75_19245 [Acetobacteraceae bacterium]